MTKKKKICGLLNPQVRFVRVKDLNLSHNLDSITCLRINDPVTAVVALTTHWRGTLINDIYMFLTLRLLDQRPVI